MRLIALTGGVGMGKSGIAAMLRRLRIPVFDSDRAIHQLYQQPGIVVAIAARFPAAATPRGINRHTLGTIVFADPAAKKDLTTILYPALSVAEKQFLRTHARRRPRIVALDIPLLYETGGETRVDAVFVASAPAFVQRARALARPGMTPARLAAIVANQLPHAEKCARANAVLQTGTARGNTLRQLRRALAALAPRLAKQRGKWDTFAHARNRP